MADCRLILDPPAAGAWNMAVDEILWDWSGRTGGCCLRLYRWAEPTLSLGYFQAYDERWCHAASRSCAAVRRISGGGAIVHDAELTYSVAIPSGHPLASDRKRLYKAVHGAIVDLLKGFGVEGAMQPAGEPAGRAVQPFLCFERRSPGDVLVGRVKVAGSAQRRSRTAVLQHGSLLLARSQAAPELPGLKELAQRDFALDCVVEGLLGRLSEWLNWQWIEATLSQAERHGASQIVAAKHAAQGWIACRNHSAG